MIDTALNNMGVLHDEGYNGLQLSQRWTRSNATLINVRQALAVKDPRGNVPKIAQWRLHEATMQ